MRADMPLTSANVMDRARNAKRRSFLTGVFSDFQSTP